MKKFLAVLIFSISVIFSYSLSYSYESETISGTVVDIVDGDTLKIQSDNKGIVKIRLYGIDAPETDKMTNKGKVYKLGQPYGYEAYKLLFNKVYGKYVSVQIQNKDPYGRSVGIVYFKDKDINLEMVKEGAAWAYIQYLRRPYLIPYSDAEHDAKIAQKGLWYYTNPEAPWTFRKNK